MKYNFDLSKSPAADSRGSLTPKDDLHWVPLQNHPFFTTATAKSGFGYTRAPKNLSAWDGASRLYLWDPNNHHLHRISLRLGEPDPTSVNAATPSKVLKPDVKLNFEVDKICINRNGSALLLSGSDGLCVMYLYGRNSTKDNTIVCRTVSVGSQIYFNSSNVIRTLQVSWHPYSDTHLGILSSDSVFRLFNLPSDLAQLEQEYYLQPVEPGKSRNAASICPVDFSFGGDHLWDRFSVFVLFSDGSIYILCPIVPFGSVYKWESILEIHSDAQTFGLKSANSTAVSNSNMAISWLEATFPELAHQAMDGGNQSTIKAHPYPLFDASLSLQGPLRKVCHGVEDDVLAVRGAECEGSAVGFLYNLISKDSVLVTAWSGGQLQIDALADEIQPVWTVDSPPRLRVDSYDHVLALAMICESISSELSVVKLDLPFDYTVWLGHPPPLLRLAIVDLALPSKTESGSLITMFVDPLMPERIYTLHDGGIDSIVLHFLPFTSQTRGKDETIRTPSVHPVLNTCQGESFSPSPLVGFVSLADSFGYSWIVGVTSTQECIVLEMNTWNPLLPIQVDAEKKPISLEEQNEINTPYVLSKELLSGPKVVLAPQASPNLCSVAADSIEGLSTLHQYFKLFHENYVEYARKVSFELKHHGPHLKKIIDDQHASLAGAEQKLLKVEEKQPILEGRIDHAMQVYNLLEQRLQQLRNLPGAHKKPLSRAEREFKSDLDQFTGVELDALRSSIETLRARLRRFTQSPKGNVSNQQRRIAGKKNYVQHTQISQLQDSLAKLSLVNSENTKKASASMPPPSTPSETPQSTFQMPYPKAAFTITEPSGSVRSFSNSSSLSSNMKEMSENVMAMISSRIQSLTVTSSTKATSTLAAPTSEDTLAAINNLRSLLDKTASEVFSNADDANTWRKTMLLLVSRHESASLRIALENFIVRLPAFETEIPVLIKTRDSVKASREADSHRLSSLVSSLTQEQSSVATLQATLEDLSKQHADLCAQIAQLEANRDVIQSAISDTSKTLAETQRQATQDCQSLDASRQNINQAERNLAIAEDSLSLFEFEWSVLKKRLFPIQM